MVNGYNSRVHASYIQQGNIAPAGFYPGAYPQNSIPQPMPVKTVAPVNISHNTYRTTVHNTLPQSAVTAQQNTPAPKTNIPEEKENPLWKTLKSDKTAIIIGSIVSLAAILTMVFSPKDTVKKSSGKNIFKRMTDSIKNKWNNYRADYKARMAAKAPERNHLTPYLIT